MRICLQFLFLKFHLAVSEEVISYCFRRQTREWDIFTSNLGVGSFLAVADIDKIKGGLGLGEAEGEVSEVALGVNAAISTHGLGETGQIGVYPGNDLNMVCKFAAHLGNGGPQMVGGFFTTVEALPNVFFMKLVDGRISFYSTS